MSSGVGVRVPDDSDFASFRVECESEQGWTLSYSKGTMRVWGRSPQGQPQPHCIKCRLECPEVSAATLYDVLHDTEYRPSWDPHVLRTFDIARLTANADVGYYAWRCPKPLKNRDVVTLRSWLPLGHDYVIINFSVKHPDFPPQKDLVRAVSIRTGYLVQRTGEKSSTVTYLAQVDPKGSLPKWVVNKSSQLLAPKAMKRLYQACLRYPSWKSRHRPTFKPWLFPEQSRLPTLPLATLSLQRAQSLENIDESSLAEDKDQASDED